MWCTFLYWLYRNDITSMWDVYDCLILNSTYTTVVKMIVFRIKKIRWYFLFYCFNWLKTATCWVKWHLYLKAGVASSFGLWFFFPLHLFTCASIKQKMQFYYHLGCWGSKSLVITVRVLHQAALYIVFSWWKNHVEETYIYPFSQILNDVVCHVYQVLLIEVLDMTWVDDWINKDCDLKKQWGVL